MNREELLKKCYLDGSNLLYNHPEKGWIKSKLDREQLIEELFRNIELVEFYKIEVNNDNRESI